MPKITSEEKYDSRKIMPQREDPLEVIAELLKEKRIERFAIIEMDWEGDILPGGTPNESGTLLIENGQVFAFWLDWSPAKPSPDGTKGWYDLGEESYWTDKDREKHSYFEEILIGDPRYPKADEQSLVAAKKQLGLA